MVAAKSATWHALAGATTGTKMAGFKFAST